MARVTRRKTKSLRVSTELCDRMTVYHLRDFVRALDEQGVPDSARVEGQHNQNTWHLVELSVTVDATDPEGKTDG